ncbi:MAG: DedA family protein, partial [Campylobacterales bacterium]|nr:DedA family protein [Campylobacterales bacterium]
MLGEIVKWIVETVGDLGYLGIIFMMFLESSFFPFPSEVVMVPAGYLSSKGEMNIFLVIIAGICGSLLGAYLNYFLALKLGRKTLHKFGHYVFIKEETLDKVEKFFADHGKISTFTGRLIPGIRQLISLPAGLAKMDLKIFTIYTGLGAGIWVTILTI